MNDTLSAFETGERRVHSGVSRSFSKWAAFFFGLHCISLSSSGLIPFSWVASVWPGANIKGVLLIAGVLCLFHGVAYAIIGGMVPKVGADYVFASRTSSPIIAFAMSWTLVIFSGIVAGGLAAWVPKSVFPALLQPLTIITGDVRYSSLADFASGSIGTFLIGGLIVLIAALTVVRSHSLVKNILAAGFLLGMVAWIIILWSLASAHGPQDFTNAWNHFMGQGNPLGRFEARVPLARAAGMVVNQSPLTMTLAGLLMGFWIYYGYHIPTFFAEEVQKPTRSLLFASVASILVSCALFTAAAIMLERLVPREWIAAEGYLLNNADAVSKVAGGKTVRAMPWITFYAAILKPKPTLLLLVAIGWIFTLINLIQTYLFYCSRLIYSWALDHVLPSWFLDDPAAPTPRRAVTIVSAIALIGLIDAVTGGPLNAQLTFVFFAVVTQVLPIAALTFLPIIKPSLFDRLPEPARRRLLGIPVASWFGGISLVYLCWMVVAAFLYPAVGVASPRKTIFLFLVLALSGIVVFAWRRKFWLKTAGLDLMHTYKTLDEAVDDDFA